MTWPGIEPLRQSIAPLADVFRQFWRDEELSVPGQCVGIGVALVLTSGLLGGGMLWASRAASM